MKRMLRRIMLIGVALAVPSAASAGVREDWQAVADAVSLAGQDAAAAQIEEAVNELSDAELERAYGEANLAQLAKVFNANAEAMDTVDKIIRATGATAGVKSAGFPDAVGYPSAFLCPFSPDRSNADDLLIAVDTIKIAREALEAAQIIWSGLSRACDETIVILGEGGNAALACIPVDIVLFAAELVVGAAEAVVEHIGFCDAAVDSAEIEGSYERLGHIHSDLTAHDTDISNQLATHDTDISSQLTTHDADLKSQLATHDADIKTLLGNIQGTVDENQRLIKIFMSRQLEVMRLLITPNGLREINEDVLTCTGDDCPEFPAVQQCPNGSLKWNCRP